MRRNCSGLRERAPCSLSRSSPRVRTPRSPERWPGRSSWEGFLNIRLRPWLRRLITRGVAIVPAIIVIAIAGESAMAKLLVLGAA
jgi:Mn2+/Fe2+ NRAMP family transporter